MLERLNDPMIESDMNPIRIYRNQSLSQENTYLKKIAGSWCWVYILSVILLFRASSLADTTVVIIHTTLGDVTVELYDDKAPVTVANFLSYVNDDFYDGVIFHRVIDDFMAQTGAYTEALYDADFTASDFNIKDTDFYREPEDAIDLEITAGLLNLRGTIAMARTSELNSATSQFFINVVNNSHLDPGTSSPYAVFGKVTQGMDVVDAIVQDIVDNGNFADAEDYFEDLPLNPIVINDIEIIRSFDEDSADFSDVPYFNAKDGSNRLFRGQGTLTGSVLRHNFSMIERLDPPVKCLKWSQAVASDLDMDASTLVLAKDTDDGLWLVQHIINEGTDSEEILVDANSVVDLTPMGDLADQSIYYRMMLELTVSDDLEDPNNIITIGEGENLYIEQIADFDAALLPEYSGNLVEVRKTYGPVDTPTNIDWSFYDEENGLVLELFDDNEDTVNGDGWLLSQPSVLPNALISVKVDTREPNSIYHDDFLVTGLLAAEAENFDDGYIYIRVGIWETTINTSDPELNAYSNGYIYQGELEDGSMAKLKFDLKHDKFVFYVKSTDLSGLAEPIQVEIVAGSYSTSGQATIKGGKKIPVRLMSGVADTVYHGSYRRIIDDGPHHDSITLVGQIAAEDGWIDLTETEFAAIWDSKTYTISSGKFQRVGRRDRYYYKNSSASFKYAVVDWNKGEYKIILARTSIAAPTEDLQIKITNSADTVLFDQTIEVKAN